MSPFEKNTRHGTRHAPFFFAVLAVLAAVACASSPALAAQSLAEQVRQEQDKAGERRASLERLTAEERRVNADLAMAEDRIMRLEENLAKQEQVLADLARNDTELREKQAAVTDEMARTELALADIMRALWEMQSRREGVGGRDLPDWDVTDREHVWSLELLSSMREHRGVLQKQGEQLAAIMARREGVGKEAESALAELGKEKETLLRSRLAYSARIQELRQEKQDAEAELASILALVDSLNLRIQESEVKVAIDKAKGQLPMPGTGTLRQKYNPSANPPVRGVTLELAGDDTVRAVHWGKVVHNDILRGFGRVVILMHGAEYYTLYAYLAESHLTVGQDVDRLDSVGKAGFVPAIEGPGVYFELRFHQKAINPEDWFRKNT